MAIGSLPTKLENLMRAYAALADDGILGDLVYAREQRRSAPRRVMSIDTARLITSFLSDPQARLPTFPRYGPLEYPFAVAVKTGTSQGYRDAWTLAYSRKFIVGVWLGRADAGTMKELGGAASSARLAHAILVKLHGAKPGDMEAESFPPPPDRRAVDLCLGRDARENCFETIREWVKPDESAPIAAPALSASGAEQEMEAPAGPVLAIAAPEHNTHIWRNPDQPAALNRLALKLARGTPGAQIVWYVDGEPFVIAEADQTVFWPLQPGAHRIQARLALRPGASRSVRVMVE
jgi:penicillin-binding protein 1C